MSLVTFRKIEGGGIDSCPLQDGALTFDIGTKDIYLDVDNSRYKMTETKSYPVGSVYITYEGGQSPSSLFGGTWQNLPEGLMYAADTVDTWSLKTDGAAILQNERQVTQVIGWYRVN